MTFEELDDKLPNGLHDAQVHTVAIDYEARTASLDMSFWVGDLDGPNREEYRRGTVKAVGLYFCLIDPPDPTYPFLKEGVPLTVSGDSAKSETCPILDKLRPIFAVGTSCYRFFVHDWNSFIHIAARDVQLAWANRIGGVDARNSGDTLARSGGVTSS